MMPGERKEAVRAIPEAQRRRIDAAMLESLAGTFRILADGGPFICSFNLHDVADMLNRASLHVRPAPRPIPESDDK